MIKIGIVNKGLKLNWGKNFGYWFYVKYFKNELKEFGFDIDFYDNDNKNFYNSDIIILDSRLFSDTIENKIRKKLNLSTKFNHLETLIKISNFNRNIVWLDNSDSAGTTSFEVLPYVKKYIKKQFYRDKNLYRKNFFRGRFYADYYQKKFNIEKDTKFNFCKLTKEYEHKLVLGWNIGVGCYFDIINFNKFRKYYCVLNSIILKNHKELIKYTLKFQRNSIKTQDIFRRFNLRSKDLKKAIHFQRNEVNKILDHRYPSSFQRLDHKSYLEELRNSKISVGAFGWGEVCYREFEAIKMGTAILFPKVDYIETWPNIFQDNFSYISYELDFSNIYEKIDLLLENEQLRKEIVENSQLICKEVYSEKGLEYLVSFFKTICE